MENAVASPWVGLVSPVVAAAIVSAICSIIVLLLNRYWSKKDKRNDQLSDLKVSVAEVKALLDGHIAADDERYAVQCRTRILQFADELMNEPDHLHTKGQFDQALDDITSYDHYCADHPGFVNERTARSAEIIRHVYDECAREHKFL